MEERAEQDRDQPPAPPSVDRRIDLNWPQKIGVPMLALIPLLAMAGVFGERWSTQEHGNAQVAATVRYPTRLRAKLTRPMTVTVENRGTTVLDTVEVAFDSTYVDRFVDINIIPQPQEAYVASLTGVQPGETRRVHVEFISDKVGRHSGRVVVRARGDSTVLTLRTIVFP
jgi:hypothetical protein